MLVHRRVGKNWFSSSLSIGSQVTVGNFSNRLLLIIAFAILPFLQQNHIVQLIKYIYKMYYRYVTVIEL